MLFAEHLYNQVLEDVAHRHTVFSIPRRLRIYMRYDRRLNEILFQAAWAAILEVLANTTLGVPAAVLSLQSSGGTLNFNPHLHGCLADGLFYPDGSFHPFDSIDQDKLTDCFANKVLSELCSRELITPDIVAQIKGQTHSGFSVWMGEPFHDAESAKFVARYIQRAPLSLQKLSIDHDTVIYTADDGTAHEFDNLEFLALLSTAVPLPYESLTRYYGWLRRELSRTVLLPGSGKTQKATA